MSDIRPKTIQIFLPEGQPRGIRIAEITTRIVQAVLVPRNKLSNAGSRSELAGVGVYMLFGQSEDAPKPLCYIGEAENCLQRLKQHNQQKEFWQQAVAVISRTQSFTKAHARHLEWYCISEAKKIGRYDLENANESAEPFVTEPMRADLMDAFETVKVLVSTLGFPVFEERAVAAKKELFYAKGPHAKGKGQMVEDGFVVFKGARARREIAKSAGDWLKKQQERLLEAGILRDEGEQLVFVEDYTFTSPSAAACMVLGRSANGWTEWADEHGRTLSERKRQE